jgi:CDP-4-dehydro-6-deoxyglucose reductase
MSHVLPLSRVARLVGIPRTTLQRMARDGELSCFDGQVELEEVLRLFPDAKLQDDTEFQRIEAIKAAAVHKTSVKGELPDAAVLAERLETLSRDYASARVLAKHYERVHHWLEEKLDEAAEVGDMTMAGAQRLKAWLARELAAPSPATERWERLLARERLMRILSANVKILPKGLSFEIEGNETLLEGGLRAGLSLAYGCSNGNCGECKCRVVTGSVVKVRPHDYVLTEAEKARGVTLACAYAPVGDVTLEATLATVGDIREQTLHARVRKIEPLGSEMIALHLVTPRSERLRFLAGQRIHLSVGEAGAELFVASCPCEERRIEVHVRRDPACALSRQVTEALTTNDEVTIRGPHGAFVLDEDSRRPVLLVADGCGYAPIKSLTQHALSLEHAPTIAVWWRAGPRGHYQENLMRSYASALDNFSYTPAASNVTAAQMLRDMAARHGDITSHDVYAAGGAGFLDELRSGLAALGLPAVQLKVETTD